MGKYASEIIKAARSFLGRKESDGTHKEIIDIYNSHKPLARGYKVKYTDAWCSTFVSAVAIKMGYTDIIPTECGCQNHIELFKKIGSWIENENRIPNPGDIIFYDWEDNGTGDNMGYSDHVGIVEKVSGNTITVIEGNYNNSVARRTITVNAKGIRGYGVPKYNTASIKPVEDIAKEVIAGKWGNGVDRRTNLEKAGYNYSEIQKAVNSLLNKTEALKVGDKVKVLKNVTYEGKTFKLWHSKYTILSLKNDRAVIGVNGVTTAAVNVANIKKV